MSKDRKCYGVNRLENLHRPDGDRYRAYEGQKKHPRSEDLSGRGLDDLAGFSPG